MWGEWDKTYSLDKSLAGLLQLVTGNAKRSEFCFQVWWLDPMDDEALTVEDEFLLGDSLLVAPVLEEGAIKRDIYLPRGR